MRIVLKDIILTIFLLPGIVTAFSQVDTTFVKKSVNKIILEGEVYYIHVVKEKETLYAISKTYNISEKQIAVENPDVFAGLKVGMVLKIPAVPIEVEETEIKPTKDFIYHVIEKDETLFFLSQKYNISIEEIIKHNPEVEYSDLQINQVIKIPRKETQIRLEEFPDQDFILHYVQQGQTLFSISKMYQVSVDEIKQINPELRDGELKYDRYIKIPRQTFQSELKDTIVTTDTLVLDTLIYVADSLYTVTTEDWECDSIHLYEKKEQISVGLFLPLLLHWEEMLDSIAMRIDEDSVEVKTEDEKEFSVNPRIIGFLEFYEGALLALDSLRKNGLSIDLKIFDTERDSAVVERLIDRQELKNLDLIVGPVTTRNLAIMSEFAYQNNIPIISPFADSYELLRNNPYLFQLAPSFDIEIKRFTEFISCFHDKTLVLIHAGDTLGMDRINYIKTELFRHLSKRSNVEDVLLKEVIYNDTTKADLSHVLTHDTDNVVLLSSTNEPYVSNVITSLNFLLKDYRIIVLGMPNWQRFRSIDIQYFHKLNMHYYTTFFIDYNKKEVKKFFRKYNQYYYTEPYRVTSKGFNMCMYGYDVMFYFLNALANYGPGFYHCLENNTYQPLLGDYQFKRVGYFGGYVNSHISIVRYNSDLNVEKLDLDNLLEYFPCTSDIEVEETSYH